MFGLPDFSVVVWLRKTDGFAALKGELLGAAATEPYEFDRVSRHGRFPLECRQPSRSQETRRRAEWCHTTSGTRSVTDHEPGRWRGLSLDQRRATHETLTRVRLVLAAPTPYQSARLRRMILPMSEGLTCGGGNFSECSEARQQRGRLRQGRIDDRSQLCAAFS